jgi:D-alanyl-D-alanine carboxypeptidase
VLRTHVDKIVTAALARTGVPSASIAIVRNHEISYTHAYGWAQLVPQRAATATMRYAIGSISKEFTAAALLLLQERGVLSIDDAAGRWLPCLVGPGRNASIRALLSHTSGIRDYWPQDYDPPEMLQPVSPQDILDRWANSPLDFRTASAWQYSNTGYTVAGLIAERAAHQHLFEILRARIFAPIGMTSAFNFDAAPLPANDAIGYTHYALGPPRLAGKEGRGWLFAAGELAMTASDLARWDIALIDHRLLSVASYRELTTEIQLANGVGTGYALGLNVALESSKRVLKHSGEVAGFTAHNRIYPDDGIAIIVLTNEDATNTSESIADELARLMFDKESPEETKAAGDAERIFSELQNGYIASARFTSNARSYFTAQALVDFRDSLGPLGKPQHFALTRSYARGGLTTRVYDVTFAEKKLRAVVRSEPGGQVEQFTVNAQ